jgi:hypothetical protein
VSTSEPLLISQREIEAQTITKKIKDARFLDKMRVKKLSKNVTARISAILPIFQLSSGRKK